MTIRTIKQQRERLDEIFKILQDEADQLMKSCPHPTFKEAISMMGCIQPVQMCEDCYYVKPKYIMGVDFSNGVDSSVS